MATELRLSALALPGLSPDSLGNYFASLGLLRVLTQTWPTTRIVWRDEVLHVVGGPATLDGLLDELVRIALTQAEVDTSKREWTQYDKAWSDAQKKGTKAKSSAPLALWQAEAQEPHLALFVAHAVPHARVSFNPLLGSGGNAGRRDFSAGWKQAVDALTAAPKAGKGRGKKAAGGGGPDTASDARRSELRAFLLGEPLTWLLEKLAAGSWFSEATKLYNSGQSPAREGQVSPWAMVLACEGLALLAGGASRRLGARTRAVGAFPFVTQPVAPEAAGEAGRLRGEIWAPIWDRPMTLAETATLFSRGRAELRGRGALTPAAFATAIRARGVDAGVCEFRRFTLGRTTSANTFEPRLEACFSLVTGSDATSTAASRVLEHVTALIEQRGFPRDRKVGQRWRFEGLRGPIEAALLDVAAEPNRSASAIALLDALTAALDRIDRNRSFREGKVRWVPLPLEWLPSLFDHEQPEAEARLALSLVSAFPLALPFTAFRFGVEWVREKNGKYEYDWGTKPTWFEHSKVAPARWVWGPGELARVVGAVLSRKLLEEARRDNTNTTRPSGRAPLPATIAHVCRWLDGEVDESLLSTWLSRLALFDWRQVPQEVRALIHVQAQPPRVDGDLALIGLMQPLIDHRPLTVRGLSPGDLLADKTGARTTESARALITLVRTGNLDAARRLASSRYAMAGAPLASFDVPFRTDDPDRLIAALLITIADRDRTVLFTRWLRPRRRQQGGDAHV
jgi:CRISPR-associated protein Csx17